MATIDQATQDLVNTMHRLDTRAATLETAAQNNRLRGFDNSPAFLTDRDKAVARVERFERQHPDVALGYTTGRLRPTIILP